MSFCILFGGKSYEHEISIVSAIALKKLLPQVKHFVFLDALHNFYLIPIQNMQSKFFSSKEYIKAQKIYPKKMGFICAHFLEKSLLIYQFLLILSTEEMEKMGV